VRAAIDGLEKVALKDIEDFIEKAKEAEEISAAEKLLADARTIIANGKIEVGKAFELLNKNKLTAAEAWGHKEFAISTIGPRL
jgi:hypothetical protein